MEERTERTGFFLHPSASLHDTGWGHPEHQGRLRAVASAVEKRLLELHGRVEQRPARFATSAEMRRVHPGSYLEALERASARAREEGAQVEVGPETPLSGASWDAIRGSCGAALAAGEEVASGRLRNAFVATRPPGHHATADGAMGFCSVNHVAVTARHLQATGAADRIVIVDWDVHHGNGTQDIFYQDPSIFYLSLHQAPHYPGTGATSERGEGDGEGATLNVPLPQGTTRAAYLAAFESAVEEAAATFDADFILISAGYDALEGDPLAGMLLQPEDFRDFTRCAMQWADHSCGGRLVAVLEGGYEPERTGRAVVSTLETLAGSNAPSS